MAERRAPGYMTEDLEPRIVSGPPRYTSRTEKSVEYVALADAVGVVAGYFYANDEDRAAGWVACPGYGPEAYHLAAPWIRHLHDARRREIAPVAALDELEQMDDGRGGVVPGSRRSASGLTELRRIADAQV